MNNNLISEIKKIMIEEDPIGLISSGAPEDEYDSEVLSIARKLNENPDNGELRVFIVNLFEKQFEYQSIKEKIDTLVDKIMFIKN